MKYYAAQKYAVQMLSFCNPLFAFSSLPSHFYRKKETKAFLSEKILRARKACLHSLVYIIPDSR